MSYLPTVSDAASEKPNKDNADRLIKSINRRMDLSSANSNKLLNRNLLSKDASNQSNSISGTVSKSTKTSDILGKLYNFIVNDQSQRVVLKNKYDVDEEEYSDNAQERESSLLNAIPLLSGNTEEEKEGILSKLWRYFKYFSMGKTVYNNWDKISKLLGLEKLTESIKGISEELGITKILQNIKDTIDDIMKEFSFGGPSTPIEGDVGKILATIRKRESGGDYGIKTKLGGTASGAYQFTDDTWKSVSKGVPGAEKYPSAWMAPPEIQDAVAKKYVEDILKESGGDYGAIPRKWYTGNIQGKMSASAIAKNKGVTSEQYEKGFWDVYKGINGPSLPVSAPPVAQTETPEPTKTENKSPAPAFSMTPKQETIPTDVSKPVENVFSITTKKKPPEIIRQDTATRVPKKPEVPLKTQPTTPQVNGSNPLDLANKFLRKDEKTDAAELNAFIGQNFGNFDVSKTPWCAAFANSVLNAAGYKGTGNASAKSFLTLPGVVYDRLTGQGNAQDAKPGDIAVFQRSGGGHVGFVQSVDSSGITIVGGNQSDKDSGGQVSSSRRGFEDLLGIRRPGTYREPLAITQPTEGGTQTQQKPKSLLETAVDMYKGQVNLLNDIFSPDTFKKFEEGITNILNDIPRKDNYTPDIGAIVQHNNIVVNNMQEQRNVLQPTVNDNDLPPILKQFITQHQ
jgi:uncharacterized protein (TIGR02594 family)